MRAQGLRSATNVSIASRLPTKDGRAFKLDAVLAFTGESKHVNVHKSSSALTALLCPTYALLTAQIKSSTCLFVRQSASVRP